jgi:hypothetical protein
MSVDIFHPGMRKDPLKSLRVDSTIVSPDTTIARDHMWVLGVLVVFFHTPPEMGD